MKAIEGATVRDDCLVFIDGVKGWNSDDMKELRPENEDVLDYDNMPGPGFRVESGIFTDKTPHIWVLRIHGIVKGSALMLGLEHHHDGDDLVISKGWQAMLDGLGFSLRGNCLLYTSDAADD